MSLTISILLSESFHFDMTCDSIRHSYQDIYQLMKYDSDVNGVNSNSSNKDSNSSNDKDNITNNITTNNNNKNINNINATSSHSPVINSGIFNIPANCNNTTIYLVLQISKILTSDSDKAVAPYIRVSIYLSKNYLSNIYLSIYLSIKEQHCTRY
jgi:hypothetical protein